MVTYQQVLDEIVGKAFTILPSKRTMVCEITLKNGFTVTGESSVVDAENFVRELGEKYSYEKAMDKVWMILGYKCRERMYQDQSGNGDDIEERLNWLDALEAAGVDNWDGYDCALEILEELQSK